MIYLLACYGMAYILKESEILSKPRNWIMQRSVFMARLLYCWYCIGFWSGIIICILHSPSFDIGEWIVWGCAGSIASALGNALMEKLTWVPIPSNEGDN